MNEIFDYIKEEPLAIKKVLETRKNSFKSIVPEFLKKNINRIIIVGSGTSFHAGVASKTFIEKITDLEVTTEYPYVFLNNAEYYMGNILVIGVSQSGTSLSTIEALKKARKLNYSTLAVTAEDNSKILEQCDYKLIIPCGEEKAGPKTKGYVASILVLYLFALETALASGEITNSEYDNQIQEIYKLADNLPKVIDSSLEWYNRNKADLVKARKISVVGYRQNYSTALEGALKLLETVRYPATPYEFEEFLHGPYNAIDEESYIILIKSPGEEQKRLNLLYDIITKITSHVYVISNENNIDRKYLNGSFYNNDNFTPLEYIIPIQILCAKVPLENGINPYTPKIPNFHKMMGSKIL